MGKYVGIDLGTTYSVVAYIDENGNPKIVQNSEGENSTASTVFFEGGSAIVGVDAKNSSIMNPENYVACAKRSMGSKQTHYQIDGNFFSPEEISSLILSKLRKDTEKALGEEILGAVITVPAYFTDAQRNATIDAAKMINLPVLALINEPTAAALSYGISKGGNESKKILVYDLGGGTFDVSIMEFSKDDIEILSTIGDSELGGQDFDNKIIEWFKAEAKKQNADVERDITAKQNLFLQAEAVKKQLSKKESVRMALTIEGRPIRAELKREDFDSMIEPLIFQSITLVERAMEEANLEYSDLDKILLVGGSTRIPLVEKMIFEETDIQPSTDIHQDEAVAIGAAFHAVDCAKNYKQSTSSKSDNSNEIKPIIDKDSIPEVSNSYTFTDRTSHGIGIETWDSELGHYVNSIILPKNSIVPAEGQQDFSTVSDYQEVLKLTVRQGETNDIKYTTAIGETELKIRPKPKGSPVRVVISCDTNSIIHVHVIDLEDNENLGEMRIDRVANLSEEEIKESQNKLGKLNIGWD